MDAHGAADNRAWWVSLQECAATIHALPRYGFEKQGKSHSSNRFRTGSIVASLLERARPPVPFARYSRTRARAIRPRGWNRTSGLEKQRARDPRRRPQNRQAVSPRYLSGERHRANRNGMKSLCRSILAHV